ncbi:transforming protein p54/c-ets-1 [Molothrus ater]|uniref:transforming protein p54/c-ets-1 n=1 Tax=Molothrus ater TaxID=84834 RepID=UPI0023E85763|nr:transforming protein p54/c-ets-1 [Molothrus ater]
MKAAVDLTIIKTEKVDIELFPSPDMECADVPLLTPSSKEMMSQALKATFSGFAKEQQRLGIPKDPQQWTETHVRDWVMWAVNEFSLKEVDFQKFCMNGAALCALGKECFLELAPDFVGDILWEHLEILQKGLCSLEPIFFYESSLICAGSEAVKDFQSDRTTRAGGY